MSLFINRRSAQASGAMTWQIDASNLEAIDGETVAYDGVNDWIIIETPAITWNSGMKTINISPYGVRCYALYDAGPIGEYSISLTDTINASILDDDYVFFRDNSVSRIYIASSIVWADSGTDSFTMTIEWISGTLYFKKDETVVHSASAALPAIARFTPRRSSTLSVVHKPRYLI